MENLTGFRKYYSYTLSELIELEKPYHSKIEYAIRYAKKKQNMYACLFNRDVKKKLINKDSCCAFCGSKEKLSIDHIIPISAGGKNELSNVQILCLTCNIRKGGVRG